MDKKILHATLLPLMAQDHTKVLMQVMDDMEVRVVPDLVEVHNLLGKFATSRANQSPKYHNVLPWRPYLCKQALVL